jgi:pimeloyl-ACP methyl ester carboxylesterase
MTTYTSHFTTLDELHLHHLEWTGGDPPVVYLPGFIAGAEGALRLGTAISPAKRVLALELRGRGQSDKPQGSYGFEQHLEDIHNWLNALGIQQIILAGHSLGASLALYFAARHPDQVKKLILLDGGVPPSELALQLTRAYYENLTYHYPSVEAYVQPYRNLPTLQPWTEEAEQLVRANLVELADGTAVRVVPRYVVEAELAHLDALHADKLIALYPHIQMPVLLIRAGWGSFGKEDQHITDDRLAELRTHLPHLQVYEMPDAGHTGILTIPDPGRDVALLNFIMD